MFAIGSLTDPFRFQEIEGYRAYAKTEDRTRSDPRLVEGERTFVGIVAGQSNCGNYADVLYTSVNASKVDNLLFTNGGVYRAADPMLGASGTQGTWLGRCADKLIDAGDYDRVIWVPISVGSTTIEQWAPGGVLHQHLLVAARRCRALGLPISAFLWQQGESSHAASVSAYLTPLRAMIASVREDDGASVPWLLGKSTYSTNGVTFTTSANTRQALATTVNGADIFAGADTDTLTGATYRSTAGGIHFNAVGTDAAAQLWANAIVDAL